MRKTALAAVLAAIAVVCGAQEVKTGTIVVFGADRALRFIQVDDKTYISWEDLTNALPNWFIVNKQGKVEMSLELQTLLLTAVAGPAAASAPETAGQVIESRIDGEFTGWEGETIFKLANGQVWQQAEYAYKYTYKYSPKVTIVKTSRGWVMQVDGVDRQLRVTRIK